MSDQTYFRFTGNENEDTRRLVDLKGYDEDKARRAAILYGLKNKGNMLKKKSHIIPKYGNEMNPME